MKKTLKKIRSKFVSQNKKWDSLRAKNLCSPIENVLKFPSYRPNAIERILNPKNKNLLGYAHPEFLNYGHAHSIFSYANYRPTKEKLIGCEHGIRCLYPHDTFDSYDWYQNCSVVLTSNEVRRDILRRNNIKSEAIGPYIHYAEDSSTNQLRDEISDMYGKIHIAFPYAELFGCSRNTTAYVKSILNCQDMLNFDTLLISGDPKQFLDIDCSDVFFLNCGGINNPYFTEHLKFILNLSSSTSSNALSATLGYTIYLGKKHYIYNIDDYELNIIGDKYSMISDKLMMIDNDNPLVSKMWGFNNVRNKSEMLGILNNDCL
jgi:hypothetical protein